jgi:CheY-like chemotaxis protein
MARILVVDDYAAILDMLEMMLAEAGHEVMSACSGVAGLELAARWRPDLVLLDVDMPGMDGVAVCRELKRGDATRSIPVLLMSGRFGPDVSERARKAGALGVMPKPFACEGLLAEIRSAATEASRAREGKA